MTTPTRLKPREDWTVEELVTFQNTGREPLTDEYRAHVARKAELHGIDPADLADHVAPESPVEDLDVEGHLERLRRR